MLSILKKSYKTLGLKARFLTYIISGIIVMGVLFCVYHVYQSHRALTQELEKRWLFITYNLAYDCKYGVMTKNKEILGQFIEGVISLEDNIASVAIYNATGRILVERRRPDDKTTIFNYQKIKETDFSPGYYIGYEQDKKPPLLNIIVPINAGNTSDQIHSIKSNEDKRRQSAPTVKPEPAAGEAEPRTIGYAQVAVSLEELISARQAILWAVSLFALLITGLGVISSFAFVQLMLKPIRAMTHTAMKIVQGELQLRLKKSAPDEIGSFGNYFNRLAEQLEKRNHEIQRLNQSLEQKVTKRTSELEQAYKQLQEQNVKLMEHDRLKSEFMTNMSHELRTPLNAIIGFSRVILKGIDGPLTDSQQTDLNAIYNSGRHLLTLINDVLDLSKIESGKLELQLEEIDIQQAAEEVISTCGALIKHKKVSFSMQIDHNLPRIVVDKTRFRQILLNILSNAIKFTYEGSIKLHVKKIAPEGKILISIADTGIGIKQADIPKIFEKFKQLDGSSTRREGGTGLGMSITREFVEIHGGDIWLESELGVGTTFYVELPLAGNHPNTATVSHQKQETQYLLPNETVAK